MGNVQHMKPVQNCQLLSLHILSSCTYTFKLPFKHIGCHNNLTWILAASFMLPLSKAVFKSWKKGPIFGEVITSDIPILRLGRKCWKTGFIKLTLCMLGNFASYFVIWYFFPSKVSIPKKIFKQYNQSDKQFGTWSGPILLVLIWVQTGLGYQQITLACI